MLKLAFIILKMVKSVFIAAKSAFVAVKVIKKSVRRLYLRRINSFYKF